MKTLISVNMAVILFLSIVPAGCDGKDGAETDAGDDLEEGTDTIDDAGGDTTGDVTVEGDGPLPEGACTNSEDLALINDPEANVDSRVQNCFLTCIASDEPVACAELCLDENTELSNDCSSCYAARIACSIENCIDFCTVNPEAEPCRQCLEDHGCTSAFEACSGLTGE